MSSDWRVATNCGCEIRGTGAKKAPYRIHYCIHHKLTTALFNIAKRMNSYLADGSPIYSGTLLSEELSRVVRLSNTPLTEKK